ncbi:4-hydroxybenzoate polyprenyltransferase [Luteibacter sp. Sphag1AF]|uniref:UbiA family prenyltransferase n=1 Tax=Luteibacter sp. Sphag1AF TaxID=2587031 RepID=UPI00161CC802|nr:UbiA family prenyltransferase [Luteibacter sp. Sphag1AF]MBB3225864.1 4-hydroxybenzoate polyprenyltransferase [Luteibacter sp. Sphag1AF]
METNPRPLCVDLDGTLIHTDLLVESGLALIHRNPLFIVAMIWWLFQGRVVLKREIARRTQIRTDLLPYHKELLAWLREEATHRPLILVTATHQSIASGVVDHIGIFSELIATDDTANVSGREKARRLVARFGERGFDYAGNHRVDIHVWEHAHEAIVISNSPRLREEAARAAQTTRTFDTHQLTPRVWLKALRLHQWIKNALIFIPLLASHRVFEREAVIASVIAFLSFGLCASGVYLLNDLLDLDADRAHRTKRNRPFASGRMNLLWGMVATPLLTLAAFALALTTLPPAFAWLLLAYLAATLAYSFKIKRVEVLDVITLAALYTVRIIGGTFAIGSPLSFWLLAFSVFIFLSLAILKRCVELEVALRKGVTAIAGRAYTTDDLPVIQPMGVASGYLSVLVLALYINSAASEQLYRHPAMLWLVCPCLLYWVTRAWLIAHRGKMIDDPVVFAVTDRTSQIILAVAGLFALLSV